MNTKQVVFIAAVFAMVFLMYFLLIRDDVRQEAGLTGGSSVGRNYLLPDFDVNDVAKVKIGDLKETVILDRKEGIWRVAERSDYPADFKRIQDSLLKIKDLKTAQKLELVKADWPKLELVNPGAGEGAGTQLDFFNQAGSVLKRIVLGKMHNSNQPSPNPYFNFPQADGRFIRIENGEDRTFLVAEPLQEFSPSPAEWLDKDFVKIEKIRLISRRKADGKPEWTISRKDEKAGFELEDLNQGQELEKDKFTQITNAFSHFYFSDVSRPDEEKLKECLAQAEVIGVETFEHFTYTLRLSEKDRKNYLKLEVACAFPKERVPGQDEKSEDKERLDREFQANATRLKEKFEHEKTFEAWLYEAPKAKVETLLVSRDKLLKT